MLEGAAAGAPAPRVTLVVASLASGGAERVISTMANYWAARGRSVALVTLYGESADFFTVDPRVKRVPLDVGARTSNAVSAVWSNLVRARRLRDAIRRTQPDVVVSFITAVNVLTLLATAGLGVPVVVSERSHPAHQWVGRMWDGLRRVTYRWADAVVVQSAEVADWVARIASRERVRVVPNPVAPAAAADAPGADSRHLVGPHTIVGMGRLSPEKGFDLLIDAFARIRASYPEWSLLILGEGEERALLEARIQALGLRDAVAMPGRVQHPDAVLRRAGLFVLPSRYEGFPNALLEAMACGLPVVAADCPSGPRQIVRDGVDGVLVRPDDADALAAAVQRLLGAPDERARLAERARSVTSRFALDRVMAQWDELIGAVLGARKS